MDGWLWERSVDDAARFVLATPGQNPLVCFGINPSTATPYKLDPTVTRVSKFAEGSHFDSWAMLNVYPQISTDPKGLHQEVDLQLKEENEQRIANFINGRPLTILAAWGNLIGSRNFLMGSIRDIVKLPELHACRWVMLGSATQANHPRHPLYVKRDTLLMDFDVHAYLARR